MLKLILFLSIIFVELFGTNVDINSLRKAFKSDVVETNIFRSRYNKYLTKKCSENFECLKAYIERLKKWDTVQNDMTLKELINNRLSLIDYDHEYWERVHEKLQNKNLSLNKTQFVSVVDLERQVLILTIWDEETKDFYFIGKDLISSGAMNREAEIKFGENHYLKTPAGIFKAKVGWRSDGEYNDDNTTLGYGHKDRFIFYFGKQKSVRYHTFDKEGNKIEDVDNWKLISDDMQFAIHAHKSSKPLGKPYSHGCIRTSDELNRFMDNNFILHKNILKENEWSHKYSKAPQNPQNKNLAGEYLIIFDKIN